jgi:aminopeptidase N
MQAMNDPYAPLRQYTIGGLDMKKEQVKMAAEPLLFKIAQNEKYRLARAAAIGKLGELKSKTYAPLFAQAVNDSSYTVSGNALLALSEVDSIAALNAAKRLSAAPAKGRLSAAISKVLIESGDVTVAEKVLQSFEDMRLSQEKFETVMSMKEFLKKLKDPVLFKRGIDDIWKLVQDIPEQFRGQLEPVARGWLTEIQTAKTESGEKELAEYVENKLKGKL